MRITEAQTASFEEVKNKVNSALSDFRKQDLHLLELCADERSATHRIACYLQEYFPDWDVDCEYNRRGAEPKTQRGKRVRPDIIVHRRGIPENLLCIEVKKKGESLENDRTKLKNFTNSAGEDKYQFGLLLVLSLNSPYSFNYQWFHHGSSV